MRRVGRSGSTPHTVLTNGLRLIQVAQADREGRGMGLSKGPGAHPGGTTGLIQIHQLQDTVGVFAERDEGARLKRHGFKTAVRSTQAQRGLESERNP